MTTMGHAFAVGATANPAAPLSTPAPNAPTAVTSIATDGAVIVSWQPPASGPSATSNAITPYIGGVAQTPTVVGAVTQATVSGLANGTSYTFSVHALNGNTVGAESTQSGANTPRANQIFGEEFNGSFLDPHWLAVDRDGDQANGEIAYHRHEQVSLDGSSNLKLVANNTSITAPGYNDANPPTYVGANVTRPYRAPQVQWKNFSALYGTGKTIVLQVSAQLPDGAGGLWPAIWVLGADCELINPLNPDNVGTCSWPNAGSEEIDIAEFGVGGSAYSGSYHVGMFATGSGNPGSSVTVSNPTTTFHTYEMDWSAGSVVWKLDGVSQFSATSAVPSTAMFLFLQIAMAGTVNTTFDGNGNSTPLLIDWVRVFNQ